MSGWGWVMAGYALTVGTWAWLAWLSRTPTGEKER